MDPRSSWNQYGTCNGPDLPVSRRADPGYLGRDPDRSIRGLPGQRAGDGLTAEVTTLAVDDLPPGDVLVEVAWSAVNYKDGMVTRPGNRVARTTPWSPGSTWWAR